MVRYHMNFSILLLLRDFKRPPVFPWYVFTRIHRTHLLLADIRVCAFWGLFTILSSAPGTPNKPSTIYRANTLWNDWEIKVRKNLAESRWARSSGRGLPQDAIDRVQVGTRASLQIDLWVFHGRDTTCPLSLHKYRAVRTQKLLMRGSSGRAAAAALCGFISRRDRLRPTRSNCILSSSSKKISRFSPRWYLRFDYPNF